MTLPLTLGHHESSWPAVTSCNDEIYWVLGSWAPTFPYRLHAFMLEIEARVAWSNSDIETGQSDPVGGAKRNHKK